MTEKKRQPTVQPEHNLGFNSYTEDELNLKDCLRFLARKIKFILAVTSVFTLCSIFYAQSITPIYRVTVGFLTPKEDETLAYSSSTFESVSDVIFQEISTKKNEIFFLPHNLFQRFLSKVESYELKQEVFVNGGFQKKFSRETRVDTDQYALEIYNSTELVRGDGPIHLELKGSKPKVISEYLTALVEAAKENVNTEINDITRFIVKTKINNLSTQIEELHQKITLQKQQEKEDKAREIVRFSKALAIAKRMGIKNNNFAAGNEKFPLWFQYGELALQQEIMSLRSEEEALNTKNLLIEKLNLVRLQQKIAFPFRKEEILAKKLSAKKLKLERSQTADLPLLKFKVVDIDDYSYSLVKPNTLAIIGFGVVFGLLISIFMAALIDLRKKEIPSAST